MQVHEFVVSSDAEQTTAMLASALDTLGFTVEWRDEWTATATRGSRVKNVLFGAFAPYSRVAAAVRALEEDSSAERHVLRMETRASGMLGGVMGLKRTRDGYAELRATLRERLEASGALVEERDPGPSMIV